MTIQEIHYRFKQEWNKLDSNYYRDFTPLEIDELLYRGLINLLQVYSTNESNQIYDDLINDYIKADSDGIVGFKRDNYTYEYELPTDYLHWKSGYINSDCGQIEVNLLGLNEYNIASKDLLQKTNVKWKRVIGYLAKSYNLDTRSIYIDSETNPGTLKLIYVQFPPKPFFGGYDSIEYLYEGNGNNTLSASVNLKTNNPATINAIITEAVSLAKKEIINV